MDVPHQKQNEVDFFLPILLNIIIHPNLLLLWTNDSFILDQICNSSKNFVHRNTKASYRKKCLKSNLSKAYQKEWRLPSQSDDQ
jgi:hypothetical protein